MMSLMRRTFDRCDVHGRTMVRPYGESASKVGGIPPMESP